MIAHGSSLCFVAPQVSPGLAAPTASAPSARVPTAPRAGGSGTDDPDPYARPAQGEVLQQEVWERLSGLEVLLAQLAGELPMPPVHYLTGLTLTAAAPGEATFTMPASEWLCAPPRARVQGGAVALLAETALSSAIQAQLPAATALAPVDLKVNYLRPLAADGRLALARGTRRSRGTADRRRQRRRARRGRQAGRRGDGLGDDPARPRSVARRERELSRRAAARDPGCPDSRVALRPAGRMRKLARRARADPDSALADDADRRRTARTHRDHSDGERGVQRHHRRERRRRTSTASRSALHSRRRCTRSVTHHFRTTWR